MKISVILPNYNHGGLVGQSIEGVLSQSHRDLELIIVDDGSTDDSAEVISRYHKADSRVIPLFLEENSGVNAAVLEGIRVASGELYFGAGADDYLCDPHFFSSAAELMRRSPNAAGVFGRSRVLDKTDDSVLWSIGAAPKEGFWSGQKFLDAFLSNMAFVPGSSAILRLDLLKQAGGHQCDLGPQSDYFINHAFSAVHGIYFLNREVAAFRIAPTTYSARATDEDYFRCHALMEQRLRAYAASRVFDPALVQLWREAIVNGRFNVNRYEALHAAVRSFARELSPWEHRNIPPKLMQLVESYLDQSEPIMAELERRKSAAHAVFREIAGPLEERVGRPGGWFGRISRYIRGASLW